MKAVLASWQFWARRFVLPLSLLLAAPAWSAERHAFVLQGHERAYYVSGPAASNRPVVLVLHGAGGNGPQALAAYRWEEKAVAEGFLAVGLEALPPDPGRPPAPLANPRFWRDGSARGALALPVDEVAYVAAVLDALAARHRIDQARIYATGFSSGAAMTWRLAVALPERFAALAPVGGYPPNALDLAPVSSPNLFYITGAEDPLNPLPGGNIETPWGFFFKPPSATVPAHWATAMHCGAPVDTRPDPDLRQRDWPGCGKGRALRYLVVDGLGHEWAGGIRSGLPARWVGAWRGTPDLTALIWDFFRLHRRD